MFSKIGIPTLCLVCSLLADCTAGLLTYSFSGTVPSGGSQHAHVTDGETFTAEFVVDTTVEDTNPSDPTLGDYQNSVVTGSLNFSGGYESPRDFSAFNVLVLHSFNSLGVLHDGVQVNNCCSGRNFFIQALTTNQSLASDEFPQPGEVVNSPAARLNGGYQLAYFDELGYVVYSADRAANVSFVASVPEPEIGAPLMIAIVIYFQQKIRRHRKLHDWR